jgi:hypothetical protein
MDESELFTVIDSGEPGKSCRPVRAGLRTRPISGTMLVVLRGLTGEAR